VGVFYFPAITARHPGENRKSNRYTNKVFFFGTKLKLFFETFLKSIRIIIKKFMIKELIEKLQSKKDYHERMSVIYMWVKQEHITKSQFIQLVDEVKKMNDN
jgi:hypothetical protein